MSLYEYSTKDKNESAKINFPPIKFLRIIAITGIASIFINLFFNYLSKPYMQTLDLEFEYIIDLIAAALVFLIYAYIIISGKIWISIAMAVIHGVNFLMFLIDHQIKIYSIIYLPFPFMNLSLFYASMLFSVIIFCLPYLIFKNKSK
jgi:hypothetical protein